MAKRKPKFFWTEDPIKLLKDAVSEEREMIVLPIHFVQQLCDMFDSMEKAVEEAQKSEIWGFYEDEYPIYTSRKDMCPELSSPMSVEEANNLIKELKEIYQLARLRTPK